MILDGSESSTDCDACQTSCVDASPRPTFNPGTGTRKVGTWWVSPVRWDPEVIQAVQKAWGLTIRDGYGQTETTAQIGNPPEQRLKIGLMGRPLPGYPVVLLDADGGPSATDGEICLPLDYLRPLGLTEGYADDQEKTSEAMRAGWYHTGDLAVRDEDGTDVRWARRRRLQGIGLSSQPVRAGERAHRTSGRCRSSGCSEFRSRASRRSEGVRRARAGRPAIEGSRGRYLPVPPRTLAPYKRIRRIEFAELPKTISGKIRRVELRAAEQPAQPVNAARTNSSKRTSFERLVLAGPALTITNKLSASKVLI